MIWDLNKVFAGFASSFESASELCLYFFSELTTYKKRPVDEQPAFFCMPYYIEVLVVAASQRTLLGFKTFGKKLVVAFFIEMRHSNPCVRHFVTSA